jgi:predicted nucleic-acid-binding protein
LDIFQNLIKAKSISKLEKLVKFELGYLQESMEIKSIKITGDFFLHPEEIIEKLEVSLVGVKLEKESIKNKIESILKNSEFYGFDVDSLSNAIVDCVKER